MAYRYGAPNVWEVISFAFSTVDAGSGTNWAGGWYDHGAAADDCNPPINHGTANSSYAAHVFLVQAVGAGGGDTTIQITGVSWDPDTGTRNGAASEDIVVSDSGAAGDFYQSTLHWIGQVTLTKTAGPDLLCNYGFCSFFHHNHTDYTLRAFKAMWQADGTDAGSDIILYHHKAAGWTYNAGAPADPPILYQRSADFAPEDDVINDEMGSWMRHELSDDIAAASSEGLIMAVTQTGARPYGIGTVLFSFDHTV